jgi:hypothetical protein
VAASVLARAREAGFAIELVGLEAGQAPDWGEARRYLDSLILEEVEDDLLEECGVDLRRDPQETWLDTVKQRLRNDLDSFRADIEDRHEEIEQWDFCGGRSFAAIGSFDDDSNPRSGCAGSSRPACSKPPHSGAFASRSCCSDRGSCYECRRLPAARKY